MQKVTIQNRENLDLVISYHLSIKPAQGLVFIEHGFTGHKDEPQLQTIAETFIKKNFTTILFDATSSTGESGISADGVTFTSHYNDLQDVINWASAQTWYQKPFSLCGHSLGASSVLRYAAEHPSEVKLLIPISPLVSGQDMYKALQTQLKQDFEKWQQGGVYQRYSKTTGRTAKVPFSFMVDLLNYNAAQFSEKIQCRTIILSGDQDQTTPLAKTQLFYQSLKCPKDIKVIPNCEHIIRTKGNLKDLEQYVTEIIDSDPSAQQFSLDRFHQKSMQR